MMNFNRAKLEILKHKHSAFITSTLYNLKFVENNEIEQLAQLRTNTVPAELHINMNQVGSMDTQAQAVLLCRAALYYALQHDIRGFEKDSEDWNKACFIVTTELISMMGFKGLPQVPFYWSNRSTEDIYFEIHKPKNEKDLPVLPSISDPFNPNVGLPKEHSQQAKSHKRDKDTISASTVDKMTSNGGNNWGSTGEFNEFFPKVAEGKLNWKQILRNHVSSITQNIQSYLEFNRRHLWQNLYLPNNRGIGKIENIALAFDVSGSVSNDELQILFNELNQIFKDIEPEKVTVCSFAHKIKEVFEFKSSKDLNGLKMDIGGGTNLDPPFEFFNKMKPDFLIVFSDMYVPNIPTKPKFPVIWVCIDHSEVIVPYGKLIHISREDFKNV